MMKSLFMGATGTKIQQAQPTTDGLIAHYPLNNDSFAKDWTTNYDASVYSGTPSYNDISTYLNKGCYETSDFGITTTDSYSISFWFCPSVLDRRNIIFYNEYIHCLDATVELLSDNTLCFGSTNANYFTTLETLSQDVWYYITVVVKYGGNTDCYINGELKGSYVSFVHNVSVTNWYIGHPASTVSLDGYISNFRIYKKILVQEEITALYSEGIVPILQQPTTDGLIAYYPLTGSADDYFQNYNGAENSVLYVEDSEYGAVASFDGDDDYINISPLDFEWNTPFSILVWISESSFTSNENSIVEISSGDYPYDTLIVMGGRVDIKDSDRRLYIRNYVNNEVYIGNESAKHPLNTWRHLVFEWDGTNLFGFEDGKLLGSNAFSFSNPHSSSNILKYLGTSAGISRFLDGKLSNIRFYNRALSEEEVLNIYKYERVQHSINIDSGLVAYYPLKQNSNDNFVNQYDGTDYNVTYDGQSAIFDGNDSIALPTTITPTTGIPYTISAWFKLDVLGVYQTIISLNSLGLDYNASIRISDTNKMFLFGQSGTTTLSGDTWYHACVVSDGSTARMYLDYSEECNNSFIANIYSDGLSLIGARKYSSSAEDEKCNGSIAKVRIYDKALTEEEITAIYNLEKGDVGL